MDHKFTIDTEKVRRQSLSIARSLGYNVNPSLPLLDITEPRATEEIVNRLLCLHVMVACACGFPPRTGYTWLEQEHLIDSITEHESASLGKTSAALKQFEVNVEALWALCWVLGIIPSINFGTYCEESLVTLLPNLKSNENAVNIRRRATRRRLEELLEKCDTAYCLHWAIKDAAQRAEPTPGRVDPYVIIERRRALEWCLSDVGWDEVVMDT